MIIMDQRHTNSSRQSAFDFLSQTSSNKFFFSYFSSLLFKNRNVRKHFSLNRRISYLLCFSNTCGKKKAKQNSFYSLKAKASSLLCIFCCSASYHGYSGHNWYKKKFRILFNTFRIFNLEIFLWTRFYFTRELRKN